MEEVQSVFVGIIDRGKIDFASLKGKFFIILQQALARQIVYLPVIIRGPV